jgi:hypothetical protein
MAAKYKSVPGLNCGEVTLWNLLNDHDDTSQLAKHMITSDECSEICELVGQIIREPSSKLIDLLTQRFIRLRAPIELDELTVSSLPMILLRLLSNPEDFGLFRSAMMCASMCPICLPEITDQLLSLGYAQSLASLLPVCDPSTLPIFQAIDNLIRFHSPFRPVFFHTFPVTILYESASRGISSPTNVNIARCWSSIVECLEISPEIAEYAMKIFSLILIQRYADGQSRNDAQIWSLYGILTILRSDELTIALRNDLAADHFLPTITQQFLIGNSLSREKVYAGLIVAQLWAFGLSGLETNIQGMLDMLKI